MSEATYDVVAVEIKTSKVLWVMRNKNESNAEACINMAILRQGCNDRFFAKTLQTGKYNDGDKYAG